MLVIGSLCGLTGASGSTQVFGAKAATLIPDNTVWLNVSLPGAVDTGGKVVVVQFWTYTCINWRRTLPYVRAWFTKYRDQGFLVIGVHTPEFDFEENIDNVRAQIGAMQIAYPIAIDNGHTIWNEFHNSYWPALYLIDAKGHVRYQQFGEGEYAATEREIQKLLNESGQHLSSDLVSVAPAGPEIPADLTTLRSPETYVGYETAERFTSTGGVVANHRHRYTAPTHPSLNEWALSGTWSIQKQAAVLDEAMGKIIYRFHARDLNLVMAPPSDRTEVRFRVLIDGQVPRSMRGADIDESGYGMVKESRMYQLIRQTEKIGEREFVIEFLGPGVQVYDFTFG